MAKVDVATVERIRGAVALLDTAETRARYLCGDFPRAERVKDLDVRYRWDLFYAAGGFRLLPDVNDYTSDHIDTALRGVVPAFVREVAE